VKCLQLASLLWTWSCTSLFLLLILWLWTMFDGHVMKICWMRWLVSKIGVASLLYKVQLITHIFTFKNLREFILQFFFLQIQSVQHGIVDHDKQFQNIFVGLPRWMIQSYAIV
jgi:hypothetical protein